MTILEEAEKLVTGDRQSSYGSPSDHLSKVAAVWSAYLGGDVKLTARDVCWMQTLLKACRDRHVPKRDNLTDGAGYLRCAELVATHPA